MCYFMRCTGRDDASDPLNGYGDEITKKEHLIGERCLMYVSATRARDRLFVFGNGSPFLPLGDASMDGGRLGGATQNAED